MHLKHDDKSYSKMKSKKRANGSLARQAMEEYSPKPKKKIARKMKYKSKDY